MIEDFVWITDTWAKAQPNRIEIILTLLRERVLKLAFGRGKELQKEVVPLSNAYGNRIDDFVDNSNEKDVISRRQFRNATSPRLTGTGRNRVASHSEMEERATRRNRITGHSKKGKGIEGINGDMSKVSFLDQGITKCN